jgi:hypothetical protein
LRPAKKLPPPSPKKQIREDPVKTPRQAPAIVPAKPVKHGLEVDETKPKSTNYTVGGKANGPSQHGPDVKRRRTDELEDKEMITSKPMRISVAKQV